MPLVLLEDAVLWVAGAITVTADDDVAVDVAGLVVPITGSVPGGTPNAIPCGMCI